VNASSVRVAVVDDEPIIRRGIRRMLATVPWVNVVGEAADGHAALALLRSERPEILFLDIQLPSLDGFEVLQKGRDCMAPAIVFVTAYDRYASRAFDFQAVDYLLKPFDAARFHTALTRARAWLDAERGRSPHADRGPTTPTREGGANEYLERLLVQRGSRAIVVPVRDIDWIQAADNYVWIYAGGARHLLRAGLASFGERLDPREFTRIHRSTIVRTTLITELRTRIGGRTEAVLTNGIRLAVSRGYRDAVRQRVGRGR
jgi:two-component system, LytTR family, response regulator